MIKIAPEISLVITTYNSPAFLELVLKSVLRQRVFPLEVIRDARKSVKNNLTI